MMGRRKLEREKILRSFTLKKEVIEMLEKLRTEKYVYSNLSDIVNDSIQKEYERSFVGAE